jgi:cell division protein FtsL
MFMLIIHFNLLYCPIPYILGIEKCFILKCIAIFLTILRVVIYHKHRSLNCNENDQDYGQWTVLSNVQYTILKIDGLKQSKLNT